MRFGFGLSRRWNVLKIAALAACMFTAILQPVHAADTPAQSVIRSQEEAISNDDWSKAYSFAAPQIQAMFPAPDLFMSMVRRGYAPLYQPRVFQFGEARDAGGKIEQIVHIIDADGVTWEALYQLEQQPDGSLRISGCTLNKKEDSA